MLAWVASPARPVAFRAAPQSMSSPMAVVTPPVSPRVEPSVMIDVPVAGQIRDAVVSQAAQFQSLMQMLLYSLLVLPNLSLCAVMGLPVMS